MKKYTAEDHDRTMETLDTIFRDDHPMMHVPTALKGNKGPLVPIYTRDMARAMLQIRDVLRNSSTADGAPTLVAVDRVPLDLTMRLVKDLVLLCANVTWLMKWKARPCERCGKHPVWTTMHVTLPHAGEDE